MYTRSRRGRAAARELDLRSRGERRSGTGAERCGPQPGTDRATYVRRLLADERSSVVVGMIDECAIGFAIANIEALANREFIGKITELYVVPEARAVSVGDEMINVITEWCERLGCIGVDAFALPGERLTKNFFESHGFVARLLTMHHRFDTGPAGAADAASAGVEFRAEATSPPPASGT